MAPTNIITKDQFGRPLIVDGTFPDGRLSCLSAFDLALASKDSREFFDALEATGKLWGGPWAEEYARMSSDLRAFRLSEIVVYSVTYPRSLIADQDLADYIVPLEHWLRERGASRAADYVAELLALYPDSSPMSDPDERAARISEVEREDPDRLGEIGNRYSDIAEDVVRPLRVLLRERGAELARECEALRAACAPPAPLSLTEILAIADDVAFARALVEWLDAPRGNPVLGFDRQPEIGRMLWVLSALATSVEVDGMTHFLYSAGIGQYFTKLQAWAKAIDAPATLAYVKSATAQLKQLNGGKLPPMADDARLDVMRELEEKDEASGGKGLFEAQDENYRDAVVAELEPRIRAYVEQNRKAIEGDVMANAAKFS